MDQKAYGKLTDNVVLGRLPSGQGAVTSNSLVITRGIVCFKRNEVDSYGASDNKRCFRGKILQTSVD